MRSTIFRGLMAVAAVMLAACSSTDSVAPIAPSSTLRPDVSATSTTGANLTRPIDRYVSASCENGVGEVLHVTGEMHWEVQRFQDASGVFHFSFKSATSGLTAVGLTTGKLYRGLMTEHITSRAEDYLNEDLRTSDIIRFVAPGSGDSYSLMVSSHIIVDQGNYVLWDQTWNEVCR